MKPFLLLVGLAGCAARVPMMPGPLGPVARAAPPAHVVDLPRADRPEPVPRPAPVRRPPPQPAPAPKVAQKKPTPSAAPKKNRSGFGNDVARAATHHLDHAPKGFRNDCSGFVMAALDRAGKSVSGSTRTLWEDAKREGRVHHRKRPDPGDLVFFDDTYDRNKNGRRDDPLTHIGIVIAIDRAGTMRIAHAGTSRGRAVLHMNLLDPAVRHAEDGSVRNDYLRARRQNEPKSGKYLAGQLFRGFAAPE